MWLMMRHASETFWISSASLGARLLRRRPAAAGRGQRWKLGHQREIVAVSEANRTLEDHRYPEGKAPTDDASRMDVSAKLTLARLVAIELEPVALRLGEFGPRAEILDRRRADVRVVHPELGALRSGTNDGALPTPKAK